LRERFGRRGNDLRKPSNKLNPYIVRESEKVGGEISEEKGGERRITGEGVRKAKLETTI